MTDPANPINAPSHNEEQVALGRYIKDNGGTLVMDIRRGPGQFEPREKNEPALPQAIKAAKFDPLDLEKMVADEDAVAYIARITRVKNVGAAITTAAAATQAWDDRGAELEAARQALHDYRDQLRHATVIATNDGKPSPVDAGVVKKFAELSAKVDTLEAVLAPNQWGRLTTQPKNIEAAYLLDAILDCSWDEIAQLLLAEAAVNAAQGVRHQAGLGPGPYPVPDGRLNLAVVGTPVMNGMLRGGHCWMREATTTDRHRMVDFADELKEWSEEARAHYRQAFGLRVAA